jgi:hypothetical protein
MRSFCKLALCLSVISFGFVAATSVVKADPLCDIAPGQGGVAVFPWAKGDTELYVYLGVSEVRTIFVYHECGGENSPPTVIVEGDNSLKFQVHWEDDEDPKVVYSGHRIYLSADKKDLGKQIPVTVEAGGKTFRLVVMVVADRSMVGQALRNKERLDEMRDMQDRLVKRASLNRRHADKAMQVAKSARARTRANVEILLSGKYSLETPGEPGGGIDLMVNTILGKAGVARFGLQARLGWNRYQLEVVGLPPNPDVHAQEWDFLANFLFRIQPLDWLKFDVPLGFGFRLFDHDDTVNWQDSQAPYRVIGVEGRVDLQGLFNLGVGVYLTPYKTLTFGVGWHMTVALNKQVQNPTIVAGDDPRMGHSINHQLVFSAGASW